MKSLLKLQDYLLNNFDYQTYCKIQPLLLDILNEHYEALLKQSDKYLKQLKQSTSEIKERPNKHIKS